MKRAGLANRGRPLEDFLEGVHARYQQAGRACVHKVPTEFLPIRDDRGRVIGCKVEKKSCVDYLGRYYNIPVAIEAKHTEDARIRFDRVEPHQADYMDDFCKHPAAVGLVLVSFSLKRFFAVPWPFWKAARDAWAAGGPRGASAPVTAYGQFWDTPGMASVSPEQLHPEWEVKPAGRFLLPYLDTIEILSGRSRQHGQQKQE